MVAVIIILALLLSAFTITLLYRRAQLKELHSYKDLLRRFGEAAEAGREAAKEKELIAQEIAKLQMQREEVKDKIINLNQTQAVLQEQLNSLNQQTAVAQERIRENEEQVNLKKQNLLNELNAFIEQSNAKKRELLAYKEDLENQVRNEQEKLTGLVKGLLVLEKESGGRTLSLSAQDQDDIKLLTVALNDLHNKDVLAKLIWSSYVQKPMKRLTTDLCGSEKVSGIYKITNTETGRSYIGQSVNVQDRLTNHVKGALGISTIADQEIHHEMRKNLTLWEFELLGEFPKEKLNEMEKFYIASFKSDEFGYNRTKGG